MLFYNKYNTRIDTNIIQYSAHSFLNFISNQNKIVKLNKRCFCKKKELPRTNCLIDFLKSFLRQEQLSLTPQDEMRLFVVKTISIRLNLLKISIWLDNTLWRYKWFDFFVQMMEALFPISPL